MRRMLPAIGLYFLAPLVAEFLLGDFPITWIVILPALSLLYGGGALIIREVVRRLGYGWPTMIIFALAYGMIEEGYTTFTLFNPDWAAQLGYHILAYGFIPVLGIGLPWTLFVLGLHTVWSISVPIAIMETLAGAQRRTIPWLGKLGLSIVIALFVIGFVGVTVSNVAHSRYIAPAPQLVGTGVAAIVIIAIGLLAGRLKPAAHRAFADNVPSPWLVGIVALVASSLFLLIYAADPYGLSPWFGGLHLQSWLVVVFDLVLFSGVIILVNSWSRLSGWSATHRLALAGGALLTYAWHAFCWKPFVPSSSMIDLASHTIFAAGVVALLVTATLQLKKEVQLTRIDHEARSSLV